MLSYIYRLVRGFEQQHGIHPNLLHLSTEHIKYLKEAFNEKYSLQQIMDILDMNLIIQEDIMHPHVAWTTVAQNKIAC